MQGVFSIIDTALSGLRAYKYALMITGNNVANAQNPDYVRRVPHFVERAPLLAFPLSIGRGIDLTNIERVEDRFLSSQWNSALSNMGEGEVRQKVFERLEGVFNDLDGGGVSEALDAFWNAWDDLSVNPTSNVAREAVLLKAQNLVDALHVRRSNLAELREDMDSQLEGLVGDVNRLASQIADLNGKIKSLEVRGQEANSFRDEREALLRELSKIMGVTAFDNNGFLQVMAGGVPLVEGDTYFELSFEIGSDGVGHIIWNSEDLRVDITDRVPSGEVRGYVDMRDEEIPKYIDRLDLLAYNLVARVNELHRDGFGLNGSTGVNFFVPLSDSEGAARLIEVNSEVLNDPTKIAAALMDVPGDNQTALRIVGLRSDTSAMPGGATFSQYYANTVGLVGNDSRNARLVLENEQTMVEGIKSRFKAVSGVSLDEEGANLLKYQHMYTATAKLFSVADEMMKTILNLGA